MPEGSDDADRSYTERLLRSDRSAWKRLVGAQLPYRAHIRRITRGKVLDVGCGIGRNLEHIGGDAVGVDTNETSVEVARSRGLEAHTVSEFTTSALAEKRAFDTLLFAHVLEHMSFGEAENLVSEYLDYLKPGGRVIIIVPQGAGFASDPTHVAAVGPTEIRRIADDLSLDLARIYSFPLPRPAGRWFRHNETVAVLTAPR